MTQSKPKIRLFVPAPFAAGESLTLKDNQAHYLTHVMRLEVGDTIAVFNGSAGEWLAEITLMGKKRVTIVLKTLQEKHAASPDLWLAFAPLRNKTDLVVEKATELGVSRLFIVYTRHAVVKSINRDKMIAHAVEAAEQCGRHDVPAIEECKDLSHLLQQWPGDRTLFYGDESGGGVPFKELFPGASPKKSAVLVGPEGGFSEEEHRVLKSAPFANAFSMGPRILRADTAAVAALACVQAWLGDWERKPSFKAS